MRFKLTVAYDGTGFHGWQKQVPPDAPEPLRTVQGVLEQTVREVVREPITLLGASRTDAGVHARGQVATFATAATIPVERMARALNSRLPDEIQVVEATVVADSFNPIGDATGKGYRYAIAHGTADGARRPLFDRHFVATVESRLCPERMDIAARALVGEHDFTSFTRKNHGRDTTVRTVYDCRVHADGPDRLHIDVSGNGFLYNMVRIIAGTLVDVGRERRTPESIPAILAARDRAAAGPTLPPEGLCLMWVRYGSDGDTERRSDEGQ